MCGIAGSINVYLSPADRRKMARAIAHRGPDDAGTFAIDNIWLCHQRLSIQDLSANGHQPMHSDDGRYTIIFNGEIYNHWQLREALAANGHHFHSASDTETLLHCFMKDGAACLDYLNGIYAFAVYDHLAKELFIARDALGVKPLYYYQYNDQLLFASELKAIVHLAGCDYTLRPEAFAAYIQLLYLPGADTPFRHIRKLLPGHYLKISGDHISDPVPFYRVPFSGRYNTSLTTQQWIETVDMALHKTVSAQLLSDAPVGFFLSGGLDSSLLAAIAAKQCPGRAFPCFTIDTGGRLAREGFEDDLPFARRIARHLGLPLTEVRDDIDWTGQLDAMIWQLDEPTADPAALFVRAIARSADEAGIKVLLSGAGADDVFSGYRRHQLLAYEATRRLIPAPLTKAAGALLYRFGKPVLARRLTKLGMRDTDPVIQRAQLHFWLGSARVAGLFLPEIAPRITNPGNRFRALLEEIPDESNALNQMLFWELRGFLPDLNLNYTDKMSMSAGVETRVPFLDTDLVALACTLPPGLKMKGTETKHVLRQVARKYLPEDIIYRKKTGFGAPVRAWMAGPMQQPVKDRLFDGSLERWNIFNPASIRQLVRDNEQGKTDGAYSIFALLAIESWLRQFAEKQ